MNTVAPVTVRCIEKKCSRCEQPAIRKARGIWCPKHYRFSTMRAAAKWHGKSVPTWEELETLVPTDMRCQVCKRQMNWLLSEGSRSTQVNLQHDRAGPHRLICNGCNTRHAVLPGDLLYEIPDGHRYCQCCKEIKPNGSFYKSNGHGRAIALMSTCKICQREKHAEWRRKNRVHSNASRMRWYYRNKEKRLAS